MPENLKYDLLLRGGRVICPASGVDGIRDVVDAVDARRRAHDTPAAQQKIIFRILSHFAFSLFGAGAFF